MTSSLRSTLYRRRVDRLLTAATRIFAAMSAAIVLLIIIFLFSEAWPALRRIGLWRFFTDASWHPLSDRYLLVPMIVGTVLTTVGAMLIATPLGLASAIFGAFYAPPPIARWHRRLVELLAGIPSVVFGLWGLVVLVPILARLGGSGQSLLAATLVLALMILPMVSLTALAALTAVPAEWIQGGAALGLGRWAIIRQVALPAARGGIVAGLLLAVTRAIGETMAVLMLAGNVPQMPDSIVAPVRTLTANIALEMGYATTAHRSILYVSGLFLMAAVGAGVLLSEICGGSRDGE